MGKYDIGCMMIVGGLADAARLLRPRRAAGIFNHGLAAEFCALLPRV